MFNLVKEEKIYNFQHQLYQYLRSTTSKSVLIRYKFTCNRPVH